MGKQARGDRDQGQRLIPGSRCILNLSIDLHLQCSHSSPCVTIISAWTTGTGPTGFLPSTLPRPPQSILLLKPLQWLPGESLPWLTRPPGSRSSVQWHSTTCPCSLCSSHRGLLSTWVILPQVCAYFSLFLDRFS